MGSKLLSVLLLSGVAFAGTLESKSLYVGIGIGAGMFVTRNYVALPVAHATKKVVKKTAKVTYHMVKSGRPQ
jgi:hypothetical protein